MMAGDRLLGDLEGVILNATDGGAVGIQFMRPPS
jgi:hypothetical protein